MGDVAGDVKAIIAKHVRVEEGRGEIQLTDKLEEIGVESLDAVEIIFDLEEKFGVEIPFNANDSQMAFETVGDIVSAVEGLIASKAKIA